MNNTALELRSAKLSLLTPSDGRDLPSGWPLVSLGDLCSFANGVNANKDAYGKGIPFANVLEIITHSHLHSSEIPGRVFVSKLAQESFAVRRGDILFNRTSETQEEVGLAAVYDDSEPIVFGGFVIRGRFNIDAFDSTYVGYALRAPIVRSQIVSQGQGAIRANIGQSNLKRILIPVPPKFEQRDIGQALSDVDELLRALEALIAKKRATKQGAMHQLLTGKARLPGFSGKWETKRLGEVADIKSGATPSTEVATYWNGAIPWCTPTDITGTPGKYLTTTERRITAEGLANCAANLLPVGTLLLCSRATIGDIKIAQTEVCTNQGFKSLVCRDNVSNEFLYYLLLILKPRMIERAIGSTFLEIGKRDLESITSEFPDQAEQTAIATVVSDMDAEIEALKDRRDKARAIKYGMMQQLLTGRIRLVKPQPADSKA
jgi:type I restriction enzyme S subunit